MRTTDLAEVRATLWAGCLPQCALRARAQVVRAASFLPSGRGSEYPDVLSLSESVDPDEAFGLAAESWLRTEAAAAYDALKADPSRAIPAEDVRAGFEAKWAARS